MRILEVIDIKSWAIGGLAETIREQNDRHDIAILEIHPRDIRNNIEQYGKIFDEKVRLFDPDIIHFHYWDSANTLSKRESCKDIKKILTHHNQKNLLSFEWDNIDKLVVHTQKAKQILEKAGHWDVTVIQHGIDIEKFNYRKEYKRTGKFGFVGRVCRWKGLFDCLKATEELGKKLIMMGRIDKGDVWNECLKYKKVMDLRFGTPAQEQVKVYHEMDCYIGNSHDGIEEGTLGLLEAMACGIPVITTPSGEAMDIIKDGENGILVDFEDYDSLKNGLGRFMKMKDEEINKMRQNAWNTVRMMSREVMARKYEKLYYSTIYKNDLVSVIIPTYNRKDHLPKLVESYLKQTYKPLEVIICDDNSIDETEMIVRALQLAHDIQIKYVNTKYKGYGLAHARNAGIFEARGNYIVFSDDRQCPEPDAVEFFVNNLKMNKGYSAVWGDKGAGKRDFIENFFCIRKKHIADAGMFNERINEYGGQSQELRQRLRNLGFNLQFEPGAKASQLCRTKSKSDKRYELFRTKTKLWLLDN